MYDLTYGQVFCGTPTCKAGRSASSEAKQFSRGKIAVALVGLMIVATSAAGAVTIRHKAPSAGFTSHFSSSVIKAGGSAGFEVALY